MGSPVSKSLSMPELMQNKPAIKDDASSQLKHVEQQKQQQQFDDIFDRSHHLINSLSENPIDHLKSRITQCFKENRLEHMKNVAEYGGEGGVLSKQLNDADNYITITRNFAELDRECEAIMQMGNSPPKRS